MEATMEQNIRDHANDYTNRTGPGEALPTGLRAPDFSLHSTPDQTVSVSDFRGQPVILAFYPADWSPCAATRSSS